MRSYTIAYKIEMVELVLSKIKTRKDIIESYQIPIKNTLSDWIHSYDKLKNYKNTKKNKKNIRKMTPTQSDYLKDVKEQESQRQKRFSLTGWLMSEKRVSPSQRTWLKI